jgi:hypothetical protein
MKGELEGFEDMFFGFHCQRGLPDPGPVSGVGHVTARTDRPVRCRR